MVRKHSSHSLFLVRRTAVNHWISKQNAHFLYEIHKIRSDWKFCWILSHFYDMLPICSKTKLRPALVWINGKLGTYCVPSFRPLLYVCVSFENHSNWVEQKLWTNIPSSIHNMIFEHMWCSAFFEGFTFLYALFFLLIVDARCYEMWFMPATSLNVCWVVRVLSFFTRFFFEKKKFLVVSFYGF